MNAIARSQPDTAFSLVELSIVIVVLGLLVGGILAGQSLIHASELRVITNELSRFKTATQAFHDQYHAVPGDMANATSFWGGVSGPNTACNPTLPQSSTPTTLTCNGDGDGLIGWSGEQWAFWVQLSDAGLIEGSFSGAAVSGGWSKVGVNVPPSKKGGGVYWGALTGGNDVWHTTTSFGVPQPQTLGDSLLFAGLYENGFFLSRSTLFSGSPTPDPGILTPTDTWNIDSKIDDGNPGAGTMVVLKRGIIGSTCTTTDHMSPPSDSGSEYAVDQQGQSCNPIFRTAF